MIQMKVLNARLLVLLAVQRRTQGAGASNALEEGTVDLGFRRGRGRLRSALKLWHGQIARRLVVCRSKDTTVASK